jgi:predicted amidohydrolase YtcJ
MPAEWALFGGRVEALEGAATAVAVAGGRLLAVGDDEQVRAVCGPQTRRRDLDGRAVLPGFIDTHMHLEKIAREMAMVSLQEVRSHAELLAAVSAASEQLDDREWVRSFGDDGAWHERQLAEARLPTREQLDGASPRHPVFLYRGPDAAVLNSRACAELAAPLQALPTASWDPQTGVIRGAPARALEAALPPPAPARRLAQLAQASVTLARMGVTTIVDPGLPGAFAASWELYRSAGEQLHQRVYLMNRLDPSRPFDEELDRVAGERPHPGEGDEHLRAWSVKLILDGEFDNAWMRPGQRAAGEPLLRYTPAQIAAVVDLCAQRGWPLCIHAMGGGAIGCVIDAVRTAVDAGARLRPAQVSIAHAFLASAEDLAACAQLGIALSMHPMLAYVFAEEMRAAWGPLAELANPLATCLRAGALLAGGSDTLPCEPLRGARYAIDRRSRQGQTLGLDEAIGARDALSLFTTRAGAYVERDDLGVIAPGALADLVIWDENPLEADPQGWLDIPVSLVAIGGSVAWER